MSPQGQDIIAKFAARLAPTQQNKLVVNGYTDNAPIGPALAREGITSNQILSQKRADNVVAVPDLAGRQARSRDGGGSWRGRSDRLQQHAGGPGAESPGRAGARGPRPLSFAAGATAKLNSRKLQLLDLDGGDGAAGAIGFGTAVPDGGGIRGGGPGATGPLAKEGVAAGAPGRIST